MWFFQLLVPIALVLLAVAPAAAATGAAAEAIARANHEYALLAEGPETGILAKQFTEDAVLLIPDLELISGNKAIAESLAQSAGEVTNVALTTTRLQASTDVAYELGTWSSTINGQEAAGYYLTFWRFDGKEWLRSAMCSVPTTWPPSLEFDNPGALYPTKTVGELRLVGDADTVPTIAEAIDQRLAAYSSEFNAGDKTTLAQYASSLYTEDAVVMLPETQLLEGEAAIVQACADTVEVAAISNMSMQLASVEAGSNGDMAVALSSYYNDIRSARGEIVPSVGNYLSVWVPDKGAWNIAASCTANAVYTPSIEYALE
jgi:ketosteroid isomerase-like protein